MKIVRRILVGLGGVLVVALALALASPKSVHAIVSTLVTVSNTPSNPVPTREADATNFFRTFGKCAFSTGQDSCQFGQDYGSPPLYTVPTGSIAVTDSVSVGCIGPLAVQTLEFNPALGDHTDGFLALPISRVVATPSGDWSFGGQNLKGYFPAGAMDVWAYASSVQPSTGNDEVCIVTVYGHLVPAN